jgi:hypothetical protein
MLATLLYTGIPPAPGGANDGSRLQTSAGQADGSENGAPLPTVDAGPAPADHLAQQLAASAQASG